MSINLCNIESDLIDIALTGKQHLQALLTVMIWQELSSLRILYSLHQECFYVAGGLYS